MSDFLAFVPYVNRPDLLERVVQICVAAGVNLIVIDNSPDGIVVTGAERFQPAVPMSFTQSMNYEFLRARSSGKKYVIHMHSDANFAPEKIQELLAYARKMDEEDRKWGILYTFYDVLCCYNVEAALAIGGYDTRFDSYYSDNDCWRRFRLAGYECHDTHIEGVTHEGSATINSDPKLRLIHSITFPFANMYYVAKWGGQPDHERFNKPFNNPQFDLKP